MLLSLELHERLTKSMHRHILKMYSYGSVDIYPCSEGPFVCGWTSYAAFSTRSCGDWLDSHGSRTEQCAAETLFERAYLDS